MNRSYRNIGILMGKTAKHFCCHIISQYNYKRLTRAIGRAHSLVPHPGLLHDLYRSLTVHTHIYSIYHTL